MYTQINAHLFWRVNMTVLLPMNASGNNYNVVADGSCRQLLPLPQSASGKPDGEPDTGEKVKKLRQKLYYRLGLRCGFFSALRMICLRVQQNLSV